LRRRFSLKTKLFLLVAIAIGSVFLGSSTAAATPATGGFKATVLVKGALAGRTEIEGLGIHFGSERPTDIYVQQVDFPGHATSGWHMHPGLVLATVKTGTITFHFGCRVESFSAGQTFAESPLEVGLAENLNDTPAQVIAAFVIKAGQPPRLDAAAPVCDGEGDQGEEGSH
jgi:quercetin dioxygenase-like cupin family protein